MPISEVKMNALRPLRRSEAFELQFWAYRHEIEIEATPAVNRCPLCGQELMIQWRDTSPSLCAAQTASRFINPC
jgi:hypothetical protein